MILISKYLVPRGYTGFAVFPMIILKHISNKDNKVLINHEKIHLRQQLEMLVVFFYIWYLVEFFLRLLQYKTWFDAYRHISFEKEAYNNEKDLDYLESRSFWAFRKYI